MRSQKQVRRIGKVRPMRNAAAGKWKTFRKRLEARRAWQQNTILSGQQPINNLIASLPTYQKIKEPKQRTPEELAERQRMREQRRLEKELKKQRASTSALPKLKKEKEVKEVSSNAVPKIAPAVQKASAKTKAKKPAVAEEAPKIKHAKVESSQPSANLQKQQQAKKEVSESSKMKKQPKNKKDLQQSAAETMPVTPLQSDRTQSSTDGDKRNRPSTQAKSETSVPSKKSTAPLKSERTQSSTTFGDQESRPSKPAKSRTPISSKKSPAVTPLQSERTQSPTIDETEGSNPSTPAKIPTSSKKSPAVTPLQSEQTQSSATDEDKGNKPSTPTKIPITSKKSPAVTLLQSEPTQSFTDESKGSKPSTPAKSEMSVASKKSTAPLHTEHTQLSTTEVNREGKPSTASKSGASTPSKKKADGMGKIDKNVGKKNRDEWSDGEIKNKDEIQPPAEARNNEPHHPALSHALSFDTEDTEQNIRVDSSIDGVTKIGFRFEPSEEKVVKQELDIQKDEAAKKDDQGFVKADTKTAGDTGKRHKKRRNRRSDTDHQLSENDFIEGDAHDMDEEDANADFTEIIGRRNKKKRHVDDQAVCEKISDEAPGERSRDVESEVAVEGQSHKDRERASPAGFNASEKPMEEPSMIPANSMQQQAPGKEETSGNVHAPTIDVVDVESETELTDADLLEVIGLNNGGALKSDDNCLQGAEAQSDGIFGGPNEENVQKGEFKIEELERTNFENSANLESDRERDSSAAGQTTTAETFGRHSANEGEKLVGGGSSQDEMVKKLTLISVIVTRNGKTNPVIQGCVEWSNSVPSTGNEKQEVEAQTASIGRNGGSDMPSTLGSRGSETKDIDLLNDDERKGLGLDQTMKPMNDQNVVEIRFNGIKLTDERHVSVSVRESKLTGFFEEDGCVLQEKSMQEEAVAESLTEPSKPDEPTNEGKTLHMGQEDYNGEPTIKTDAVMTGGAERVEPDDSIFKGDTESDGLREDEEILKSGILAESTSCGKSLNEDARDIENEDAELIKASGAKEDTEHIGEGALDEGAGLAEVSDVRDDPDQVKECDSEEERERVEEFDSEKKTPYVEGLGSERGTKRWGKFSSKEAVNIEETTLEIVEMRGEFGGPDETEPDDKAGPVRKDGAEMIPGEAPIMHSHSSECISSDSATHGGDSSTKEVAMHCNESDKKEAEQSEDYDSKKDLDIPVTGVLEKQGKQGVSEFTVVAEPEGEYDVKEYTGRFGPGYGIEHTAESGLKAEVISGLCLPRGREILADGMPAEPSEFNYMEVAEHTRDQDLKQGAKNTDEFHLKGRTEHAIELNSKESLEMFAEHEERSQVLFRNEANYSSECSPNDEAKVLVDETPAELVEQGEFTTHLDLEKGTEKITSEMFAEFKVLSESSTTVNAKCNVEFAAKGKLWLPEECKPKELGFVEKSEDANVLATKMTAGQTESLEFLPEVDIKPGGECDLNEGSENIEVITPVNEMPYVSDSCSSPKKCVEIHDGGTFTKQSKLKNSSIVDTKSDKECASQEYEEGENYCRENAEVVEHFNLKEIEDIGECSSTKHVKTPEESGKPTKKRSAVHATESLNEGGWMLGEQKQNEFRESFREDKAGHVAEKKLMPFTDLNESVKRDGAEHFDSMNAIKSREVYKDMINTENAGDGIPVKAHKVSESPEDFMESAGDKKSKKLKEGAECPEEVFEEQGRNEAVVEKESLVVELSLSLKCDGDLVEEVAKDHFGVLNAEGVGSVKRILESADQKLSQTVPEDSLFDGKIGAGSEPLMSNNHARNIDQVTSAENVWIGNDEKQKGRSASDEVPLCSTEAFSADKIFEDSTKKGGIVEQGGGESEPSVSDGSLNEVCFDDESLGQEVARNEEDDKWSPPLTYPITAALITAVTGVELHNGLDEQDIGQQKHVTQENRSEGMDKVTMPSVEAPNYASEDPGINIEKTVNHMTLASGETPKEDETILKMESTIQATTPNELELNVSKLVEEHPELLDAANLDLTGAVTGKLTYTTEPKSEVTVEKREPIVLALQRDKAERVQRSRERVYKLLPRDIQFCVRMIEKYGEDYEAMAKDEVNVSRDSAKGIARKIRVFKESPQYEAYLKQKH